MRGPMLAQILSTFGLALLLRYTRVLHLLGEFRVAAARARSRARINLGGIFMAGRSWSPASSPPR